MGWEYPAYHKPSSLPVTKNYLQSSHEAKALWAVGVVHRIADQVSHCAKQYIFRPQTNDMGTPLGP